MHRRGFTLIELLVVVGIIALLIAILLPSLNKVRVASKRTVSASRMRQIGVALEMYANDHKGLFPETTHGLTFERSWIYTLEPYVGEVDQVRICPADPKGSERLERALTSYVLNEYVAVPYVDPFGRLIEEETFTNLHRLRNPGLTITTFVGADDMELQVSADHTHSRLWFMPEPNVPWDAIRRDIQPDRYTTTKALDNTIGSSNYLYADAHVESILAEVMKNRADERVNFARPWR
jgi:prepilin-type N-terminal cleavage/methylation domain-containing protein/prepilin-type processing-associated H-X9-DG protein